MLVASAALLLPLLPARTDASAAPAAGGGLQGDFERAAAEYGVPRSVLLGVSYLQSRWDSHGGAPSVTGGYGPMHLTDAATALAEAPRPASGAADPHGAHATGDLRGDDSRAARRHGPGATPPRASAVPPGLRTLERASRLSGIPAGVLHESPAASVRGGAALLADAQRALGRPATDDPADWYGAVARFSGAGDPATATAYADDVFAVIRAGVTRVTDGGDRVTLAADPEAVPRQADHPARSTGRSREPGTPGVRRTECPRSLACEWIGAPYQEFGDGDYGNHDKADRPVSLPVRYIVVHDIEGFWDSAVQLVQDPAYVSWQYTLRSSDGHIAQHVPLKDVAWHAGNWYVNAGSVGLEHEGFLASPDAWYTEAMYRSSARLVRYLAKRFGVPLDRRHIIGHDNVPGPTTASIRGMHTDPGPYWDWAHYFELLGRPFVPTAGPRADAVTVRPRYGGHRPVYTGCVKAGEPCTPHGSGAVRLHSAPAEDAPLIKDIGLRPDGDDTTTDVNDIGARASTGQQFAVAERRGAWTAIWYLGQKAWFHNPRGRETAVGARGVLVTPKPGAADIPVYGRAYPEADAYPAGVPVQSVSPLPYRMPAGQRYVSGGRVPGEFLYAPAFDTSRHRVVRGLEEYYGIQFGHRLAYVKASDVRVVE
ncbi:N-acetylmuramoyl-L-alanine amidase [Streptomyces sp. NPDC051018]|uniref:N-acetylmuramoyl-L-alanine amidase n=1 Tax=Streptomyces sp. NPDC051018 TaxID=3365639 RepID=UPI00379ABBFF